MNIEQLINKARNEVEQIFDDLHRSILAISRTETSTPRSINLAVPHSWQLDRKTATWKNDCGCACVAMYLKAQGENVTVNEACRLMGKAHNRNASFGQLRLALRRSGHTAVYAVMTEKRELVDMLCNRQPFIALLEYDDLPIEYRYPLKTQDFWHFVLVSGIDGELLIVNDPLHKTGGRLWHIDAVWEAMNGDENGADRRVLILPAL